MWARLLSGTNQPDFLLYKVIIEEKRRAKALMQAEKMKKDAAEKRSKSPTTSPSQHSPTTVKSFNPTQFLQLIMTICSFFKMKWKLSFHIFKQL
jgi:hypothetical protein